MANSAEFQLSYESIKLDELTTIQISTDTLRVNFEIIIHLLKQFNKKLDGTQHETQNNHDVVANQINDLNARIHELESKDSEDKKGSDEKISSLLDLNKDLSDKLRELQTIVSNNQSGLGNTQNEIDSIKNDILYIKEDMKEVSKIKAIEKTLIGFEQNLESVYQKLEKHDKAIEDILNRINQINRNVKILSFL